MVSFDKKDPVGSWICRSLYPQRAIVYFCTARRVVGGTAAWVRLSRASQWPLAENWLSARADERLELSRHRRKNFHRDCGLQSYFSF